LIGRKEKGRNGRRCRPLDGIKRASVYRIDFIRGKTASISFLIVNKSWAILPGLARLGGPGLDYPSFQAQPSFKEKMRPRG